MDVSIVTIGSQGDIVPYLALARGLQKRGHTVRIAALSRFKAVVERHGCAYYPLTGDADEVIRLLIGVGVGPGQYFRNLDRMLRAGRDDLMRDVWNACEGADVVVYSLLGSVAWHVAQKTGIRAIRAFPCPLDPTPDFPTMTAPRVRLGGAYNRLTYKVGDWLWGRTTHTHLRDWREAQGLPALPGWSFPYRMMGGKPVDTLYMFSPTVVPKPRGWGPHHHVTGYWFLDEGEGWNPPENLRRFIDGGPAPLYVGFGSMLGGSFTEALKVILESLRRTGQRAVLASGWGNLSQSDLPDAVFAAGYVPHDWLFPRVAAVIHHGGMGTTAAGLRAGRPTLVVPFGGDQPFWGERVHALGAGPRPLHRKRMSVERLAEAIAALVGNPALAEGARRAAERISAERGVENAVALVTGE